MATQHLADNITLKIIFKTFRSLFLTGFFFICLQQYAVAQAIDFRTFWSGWDNARTSLERLPAYELNGTCTSNYLGTPPKTLRMKWRSLRDGAKYLIEWQNIFQSDETNRQAYDGTTWYGLTQSLSANAGIVTKTPIKTEATRPEEDLRKKSAGLFFPFLDDIVDRPMNFGARSLIQGYQIASKFVKITTKGDLVILAIPPQKARELRLPDVISLQAYNEGFYPIECKMTYVGGAQRITFSSYQSIGSSHYPAVIKMEVLQGQGSQAHLLMTYDYSLKAELRPSLTIQDFQIRYQNGTKLYDDRIKRLIHVGHEGIDWGKWIRIAALALLILVIIGYALFKTKKRNI